VLTIFFLKRDNLHFGWNFLLAAAMSGVATATKLVGVYFFLAVGLTLLLGLLLKKASWKKTGRDGIGLFVRDGPGLPGCQSLFALPLGTHCLYIHPAQTDLAAFGGLWCGV
jgi:hypothetical protein